MQQEKVDHIKQYLAKQFNLPMDQIETLLPSFLVTLDNHMKNLENALEENNLATLGQVGHTIKGAFLNLGLEDCAGIALKIEQNGKAGDEEIDYRRLVEDLRIRINPVLE